MVGSHRHAIHAAGYNQRILGYRTVHHIHTADFKRRVEAHRDDITFEKTRTGPVKNGKTDKGGEPNGAYQGHRPNIRGRHHSNRTFIGRSVILAYVENRPIGREGQRGGPLKHRRQSQSVGRGHRAVGVAGGVACGGAHASVRHDVGSPCDFRPANETNTIVEAVGNIDAAPHGIEREMNGMGEPSGERRRSRRRIGKIVSCAATTCQVGNGIGPLEADRPQATVLTVGDVQISGRDVEGHSHGSIHERARANGGRRRA